MEETKMQHSKSVEECAYYFLIGMATSTLSNNKFLDNYGFAGPGKTMAGDRQKEARVSSQNYIISTSQWPKFKIHVNNIYRDSIKMQLSKKNNNNITKTMVTAARKEVAKQIGPGLLTEYFVPTRHGSHYFALRKDGLIANGYPDSVFASSKTNKGVGVGLGFQRDHSHGLCQTFAIMWLLISQERTRSIEVSHYKAITKSEWNRQCADWHRRIWKNLVPSEYDGKIYLHNANIALQFLEEFTTYCDWSWDVDELVRELSTIDVDDCPPFNEKLMTALVQGLAEKSGHFKGMVTLSGLFKYLNSDEQKGKYMELWFDDH